METLIKPTDFILLIGEGNLTASVAVCLLNAGHRIDVYTQDQEVFNYHFKMHIASQERNTGKKFVPGKFNIFKKIPIDQDYKLAILLTPENLDIKQALINRLVCLLPEDAIIAINTESIPLNVLQRDHLSDERLIGLNWSEPAHTTFFLEIIYSNNLAFAEEFSRVARLYWGKDPYIVKCNGIRSRLLSAMAREAAFLVDNGYASVEDIDRACRNDAGYYLPFSGNCRYMDLMGTYAYGMVMKDLNPDLSKYKELPEFFKKIIDDGGKGMKNEKGFYNYAYEDVVNWEKTMEEFSYRIQALIEKYPFNYGKETNTD